MLASNTALSSQPVGAAFDPSATFRRILAPIDFSEASKRVLATVLELQRRFGSEVCLFNVTEAGANDEFLAGIGGNAQTGNDLVDDATGRLRRFVENVFPGASGLVTYRSVVEVDLAKATDDVATKIDATLVVLGMHSSASHVLRSTSEKIVQAVSCPVMLVQGSEEPPH